VPAAPVRERCDHLDAVAVRGYFNSPEMLACEQADITVTLPEPMTSGAKSEGRQCRPSGSGSIINEAWVRSTSNARGLRLAEPSSWRSRGR
jgi:hypothetical protein